MAKKKYYQSKKDRKDESRGMERRLGDYKSGHDARRRMEYEGSAQIHEDRNAVANLPQDVKYHEWRGSQIGRGYLPENLDDTGRGIDRQMEMDDRKMMKHLQPEKY